jgi:predicted house-cleaning NTP pyrophosphatase (Maf/HAM1 superfamily)
MITGLRMMNRLQKCSKQLKHDKVHLGAITIAEVSYYIKSPTKLKATGMEMNQAHS